MNVCLKEDRLSVAVAARKRRSLIEVQDLEIFVAEHLSPGTHAMRFDLFLLLHVADGMGSCRIDTQEFDLSTGAFYCVYPGQTFVPGRDSFMTGTAIYFAPEFVCPINDDVWRLLHSELFNIYGPCVIVADEEAMVDSVPLLQTMMREYTGDGKLRFEVIRSLLRVLIISLDRNGSGRPEVLRSRYADQVNAFYDLVNKHLLTHKKVSEYARLLGMTANHLNLLVNRVSGFSPKHYIQQQILLEAKRQLRWGGKSMKEIAYGLGYIDTSHFSKFFKNFSGESFTDYRQSNLPA
jgi:AraC family transcriptional activator of pobA